MGIWPGIIRISLPSRTESPDVAPVNRDPAKAEPRKVASVNRAPRRARPPPAPVPPARELQHFIHFCRDALVPLIGHCSGVKPAELRVLNDLRSERGDSAAVIRKRLAMDRGQISRLLTRLETRGLLTREKRSGRVTPLSLTPMGRALVDKATWAETAVIAALLEDMTADDHRRLREAIAAVEELL